MERRTDENNMKKSKTFHRQRSSLSVMEEQTDLVSEIIEKEFIRASLLDTLQQQITKIVENIIERRLYDFQNQLNQLFSDVQALKNCSCHESTSKQSLTLSKNSSFNEYNELYFQDDQAKYLKSKFKHLKKNVNQKVSSLENHISVIIEQQKDTRESLRKLQLFDLDIKHVEHKLQEQILQSIQKQCRENGEGYFQQCKIMIEETSKKIKGMVGDFILERESMIWTIVNDYKIDMDNLNSKVTSMNTLLNELKDNHTWFSQIWKRK